MSAPGLLHHWRNQGIFLPPFCQATQLPQGCSPAPLRHHWSCEAGGKAGSPEPGLTSGASAFRTLPCGFSCGTSISAPSILQAQRAGLLAHRHTSPPKPKLEPTTSAEQPQGSQRYSWGKQLVKILSILKLFTA